ncbi:hypothetical protein JOQ06_014609 [Pogonophryne albipinna]|uniref:Uncharacterized protein n=1 Tax=Pogonophryne albipinna TaxID=1090488 RepID=A0AAD6FAL5_9TELE|nr:hypothetical protein JOQ06_014609 [Pogonophryne albipinna]
MKDIRYKPIDRSCHLLKIATPTLNFRAHTYSEVEIKFRRGSSTPQSADGRITDAGKVSLLVLSEDSLQEHGNQMQ